MTLRIRSANIGGAVITSTGITLSTGTDLSVQSNASFAQANAARNQANAAFNHANTAYSHADNAHSVLSSTFATLNTSFDTVNTAITNGHNQANLAYAAANNSNLKSGGLVSGTLNVSQDLIVGGNIYLEGNTTYINVATYSVEDPLIYLASNNKLTDSVDIGFMGGKNTGGTYSHTGLARDATDGKWKLFDGLAEEGHIGNVIDFANTVPGILVANVESSNVTSTGNITFSGTGLRIRGDMSNATIANRLAFQTSVADSSTTVLVLPNGTGTNAQLLLRGGSTASNDSFGQIVLINNTEFRIASSNNLAGVVPPMTFLTGSTERMRISNTGNVGIGTTSPESKLSVGGNPPASGIIAGVSAANGISLALSDNVNNSFYVKHVSGGAATIGTDAGGQLAFATNGFTERMRITSAGNVGIGTNDPSSALHVTGSGSPYITVSSANTNNFFQAYNPVGLALGTVSGAANANIAFYTSSTEKMRIDTSGNVGIGTSSPGVRLDASGSIRASSQLISTVATGTAPLAVSSTTLVTNLNADLIDGYQGTSLIQRTNAGSQATLWDPYGNYYTSVWSVGNDYNNFVNAGSYHVDPNASNRPVASYGYLRIWRHVGANYNLQEFTSSTDSSSTYRRVGYDNGAGGYTWGGWAKYWSDGNDGSGSGLDADLWDGYQFADYLNQAVKTTSSPTFTGLTVSNTITGAVQYVTAGMINNTDSYMNFRVMRNSNSSVNADGMFIGYGNSGSGITRIFGGGATSGEFIKYSNYSYEPGSFRAPIFYDSNDTTYFVDPNSGAAPSRFWTITPQVIYFGGNGGNSSVGNQGYALYQEAGEWTYPYPDLAIAYHTGIKIGAYFGYNGTRFYNNNDMGTQIASVGDGDNNFRSYYNVIAYASDGRLKENIQPITNAIEKVKKITGMTFDWKPMVKDFGFEPNNIHEAGVIAQEIEAVLPEAVEIAPFDYDWKMPNKSKSGEKYLTVKYEKIVPLLIQAIKEQQEQIEELKNLIKEKLS